MVGNHGSYLTSTGWAGLVVDCPCVCVCVHVQATNPVYQKENLYFSTFTLKETDMHALDNWDSTGYTAPSPYYADL